jgi:hypothetical protein
MTFLCAEGIFQLGVGLLVGCSLAMETGFFPPCLRRGSGRVMNLLLGDRPAMRDGAN